MNHGTIRTRGKPSTGIAKGLLLLVGQIPRLSTHPLLASRNHDEKKKFPAVPPDHTEFWINILIATVLVLVGGVFAGLTLALMGQDEIYLQVMEQSGEPHEKRDAKKVLRLLKRGKHWVLVSLLLSNVITNETLPIVLDHSLGGGWSAVLISTVSIVIFGEIIPQSICVRYGLAIGARLSPFVLGLMYIMYPVAYPIALLLDKLLGEDHGTLYKKSGLKTLVTLHKTLGPSPSERLNQDEVTIITAVLDLKEKPVESIMTPIENVFTMSADTVLDEPTTDAILRAGYSRIPIHQPGEPFNFIGMLLVKILITYDPEDCMKVSEFSLATLPETARDTSCLDIVNFFQEGKSHMVLVSEHPGENYGALGVVTLEDVIEELIGEEIVDESDVYIDVHKAIRRLNPSPLFVRRSISSAVHAPARNAHSIAQAASTAAGIAGIDPSKGVVKAIDKGEVHIVEGDCVDPHAKTLPNGQINIGAAINPEVLQHLKHLGPSNLASNPRQTSSKTVKIKAGANAAPSATIGQILDHASTTQSDPRGYGAVGSTPALIDIAHESDGTDDRNLIRRRSIQSSPGVSPHRTGSYSDDHGFLSPDLQPVKKVARSGSLVESIRRNKNGVPKTVIETTSSEDNEDEGKSYANAVKGKKKKSVRGRYGDNRPLLGDEESGMYSD